jgi:HEPN domain-containing protein
MPPEAESPRAAETRAWFARSRFDLGCAETGLQAVPPLVEDVLFHCQQAAEKAMKGFLTRPDATFARTHDLRRLVDACVAIDASLEPAFAASAPLSEFAWRFRYPGEPFEPSPGEAAEAPRIARPVVAATAERLRGAPGFI